MGFAVPFCFWSRIIVSILCVLLNEVGKHTEGNHMVMHQMEKDGWTLGQLFLAADFVRALVAHVGPPAQHSTGLHVCSPHSNCIIGCAGACHDAQPLVRISS